MAVIAAMVNNAAMVTLDVDPQAAVLAPRPMPDEVVILACDASGARCWVTMSKKFLAEGMPSLLTALEDGTARLYAQDGQSPDPEWALDPATLAAHDTAREKHLADPANIRPGDKVIYRDPRQQPGVPRSDDVM